MAIQRLSNAGQNGFRYKSLIAGITPVASVPTIGAATALTFSTASVAFTAPGAYAATTFTATSSPGGLTGTSATSPITVSGLSEQTAYTFTVTATNASGTSSPSAASSSITTPVAFSPDSGYDSLATVTLSASTSSITFSGIPSGYKHLQVRALTGNTSGINGSAALYLNSDTTAANYRNHYLYGSGSAAGAGTDGNSAGNGVMGNAMSTGPASWIIDLLDYGNANKYKTIRILNGYDANGTGYMWIGSNLWMNTSAVTAFTITAPVGTFLQHSSFALYGVK